jgi:regulatory protein
MMRKLYSAYESAVESLARRSHSRKELKNKLFRKGFPGKDIYQALDRLEELGYLDDRKFAIEYARHRLRQSPRGRMLLSSELIKRGVSREIVDQVLPEVFEEYPEDRLVEELVTKWRRTRGDAFTAADISKLARSLSRKGFEWDAIRRQVGHLTPMDSGTFD